MHGKNGVTTELNAIGVILAGPVGDGAARQTVSIDATAFWTLSCTYRYISIAPGCMVTCMGRQLVRQSIIQL